MPVTIDASVWLSSLSPSEPGHHDSNALLAALLAAGTPLHQPALFMVEACATIARRTRDPALASDAAQTLMAWPSLVMHELDHSTAVEATAVAASGALRGADAVYVATARRNGSTLVTLDVEMRTRGAGLVETITPVDWLARHAPPPPPASG